MSAQPRDREQGEQRMRPRFRSVPDIVEVSWQLTQNEFDALDTFFNDTLRAGERTFDARVHFRGTALGTEWFTCQWVGEYTWNAGFPSEGGFEYEVSARFRLLESLGATRTAPGITAGDRDTDTGGARMAGPRLRSSGTDGSSGGAFTGRIDYFLVSGAETDDGGAVI